MQVFGVVNTRFIKNTLQIFEIINLKCLTCDITF